MANNGKQDEKYEILGMGSFGAVITPALNNINNNITKRNRKKYVTKLFFNKNAYNNLQTRRNKIVKIMRSHEGSKFEPYKRNIILGQFNNHIKNTMKNGIKSGIINNKIHKKKKELDENKIDENEKKELLNKYANTLNNEIEISNNTQIYAIRSPILGKSFNSLPYERINNICKNCSILNMLSECKKLFEITAYLAENEYIHGDLESRNILLSINHDKCELFIIDYDRFDTFDEYTRKYIEALEEDFFLPYGPPESTILVKEISPNNKNKKFKNELNYKNNINDRIKTWSQSRMYYWFHYAQNINAIKKYYKVNDKQKFTDEISDIVFKFMNSGKKVQLKYFDNFVLGLTLLDFFRKVYDIDEFDEMGYDIIKMKKKSVVCKSLKLNSDEKIALREFRDNILYPMTSLTIENRIDPNEVLKRMNKVLCKLNKNTNSSCTIQGGKRKKTLKKDITSLNSL
jgi:hypothetical protein